MNQPPYIKLEKPLDFDPRAEREKRGLTAIQTSAKMGISFSFLCELERGRYAWTEDLVKKWKEAVGYERKESETAAA